jgi:hypothetical protein
MERKFNLWASAAYVLILSISSLYGMARRVEIDRTQDPLYSEILKNEYQTKKDLLLFQDEGYKEILIGKYGDDLPKENEMPEKLPFKYYAMKIIGILPAGSVIKLTTVKDEGANGLLITNFYVDIVSTVNNKFSNKNVNATALDISISDQILQFDPLYIEQIKTN